MFSSPAFSDESESGSEV